LNVNRVSDDRQNEIHTAEPLVPELSPFGGETAIARLKRYKMPDIDQILTELFQTGDETLHSKIHKLINSVWNKEDLIQQ
jgi:hypothetical protein